MEHKAAAGIREILSLQIKLIPLITAWFKMIRFDCRRWGQVDGRIASRHPLYSSPKTIVNRVPLLEMTENSAKRGNRSRLASLTTIIQSKTYSQLRHIRSFCPASRHLCWSCPTRFPLLANRPPVHLSTPDCSTVDRSLPNCLAESTASTCSPCRSAVRASFSCSDRRLCQAENWWHCIDNCARLNEKMISRSP